MLLGHPSDNLVDHFLSSFYQIAQRDRLVRHPFEEIEFLADVSPGPCQNLEHRPAVANEIDDEGATQRIPNALVL